MKKYQLWVQTGYWKAPYTLQSEFDTLDRAKRMKAVCEAQFAYNAYKIIEVEV